MLPNPHLEQRLFSLLRHSVAAGITPGASLAASGKFGRISLTVGHLASHRVPSQTIENLNRPCPRIPPGPELNPVNRDTRYDLASVSKAFSTVAIASVFGENYPPEDLSEVTIHQILPEFPHRGITVQQVFTHTWGSHWEVPTWPEFWTRSQHESPLTIRRNFLHRALTQELQTDPGTHFEYACTSFHVLMQVCERLTGQRFADLVRERVLTPLQLNQIEFGPVPSQNTAAGYGRPGAPDISLSVLRDRLGWNSLNSANSGLFARASDLLRFGEVLLQGLHGPLRAILTPAWIEALNRPQVWVHHAPDPRLGVNDDEIATAKFSTHSRCHPAPNFGQAFGFRVGDQGWFGGEAGSERFGHAGYSGTVLSMHPGNRSTLALLTNRIHPSRPDPEQRLSTGEIGVLDPALDFALLSQGPRNIAELRQAIGDAVHGWIADDGPIPAPE